MSIYDVTPEMEAMIFQFEGKWISMADFARALDRICLEAICELPKA
jgi:hypothetical protein